MIQGKVRVKYIGQNKHVATELASYLASYVYILYACILGNYLSIFY